MKYSYEFREDPFGDLMIVLPEELSVFSDFIQDISTEQEVDEYIGYISREVRKNSASSLRGWQEFLAKIYNKLLSLDFKSQNISFDPGLTKIQKYKMRKNDPDLPDVLINKCPGCEIKIHKF
ncbi:hypothetical protein [Rossellomorea marisflavi]|uniref:hypothetical protein n=1 Tax=Rossellomorea marisflavi TaxID=189381 RepID=UPI003D2F0EDE